MGEGLYKKEEGLAGVKAREEERVEVRGDGSRVHACWRMKVERRGA